MSLKSYFISKISPEVSLDNCTLIFSLPSVEVSNLDPWICFIQLLDGGFDQYFIHRKLSKKLAYTSVNELETHIAGHILIYRVKILHQSQTQVHRNYLPPRSLALISVGFFLFSSAKTTVSSLPCITWPSIWYLASAASAGSTYWTNPKPRGLLQKIWVWK